MQQSDVERPMERNESDDEWDEFLWDKQGSNGGAPRDEDMHLEGLMRDAYETHTPPTSL